MAAELGWPLEHTACLGLHAAPLSRMRPHLAPGQRLIVLLRDGAAVADLAGYLADLGFGVDNLADREYVDHLAGVNRVRGNADLAVGERLPGFGRSFFARFDYSW